MKIFKFKSPVEKYKFIIIFFGTLLFLIVGTGAGLKATSNPNFCSICHAMSPQVHTWKASTHNKVACTDCHVAPGVENLVKEKASGVKRLFYNATDKYLAPIRMPNVIPNESCQKCHDMSSRTVSASGDIIIDHQVHEIKKVACVTCHDGVAHGKVSEKRVTYKTDYAKWNGMLAKRFMKDTKSTRPQMGTCMECHELKRAPLSCNTCHETSMLPEEHKTEGFITKEHMQQAKKDILYCNTCHSYTTKNQVDVLKGKSAYVSYLSGEKPKETTVTVTQYAKTNDYCVKCHSVRPQSHNTEFMSKHGLLANQNRDACFTCHDHRINGDSPVVKVSCASCHPSSHPKTWQKTHPPAPIRENQKLNKSCMRCHIQERCAGCHTSLK